jgi:hypothetical protein
MGQVRMNEGRKEPGGTCELCVMYVLRIGYTSTYGKNITFLTNF